MPHSPPTVLLTRPEAQSQRFAAGLTGLRVVISPVLEIRPRPMAIDPRAYDELIFTSENGIRATASMFDLTGLHGFAVGPHTLEVGAEYGLTLKAANGSAESLIELIAQEKPSGRLLHLRGANSRGEVADRLTSSGIETHTQIAYDQVELSLNPEAIQLISGSRRVILPIFSPRSASILGAACNNSSARLVLVAISDAALDAWSGPEPSDTFIAFEPSARAMRQEILRQAGRSA